MFRHAETNIRWMLTLSILFHVTFLSIIFSSGFLKRSDLFTARHSPLSSIQVSIVKPTNDNRPVMQAPLSGMPNVEKTKPDVRKAEADVKKADNKQLTKIEKLRENRILPSANNVISALEKKEGRDVRQDEAAVGGSQSDVSRSDEASERMSGSSSNQESRLITGDSMVSGPVVDLPSFKYDYYLGLIKNKVDNRWNQPVAHNKTRKALIEFTINRKGDISNVRIADSSGDGYFDQTALRAVTLSAPFPPLPRGFKGDTLRVHYRFIFGEKS